MVCSGMDRCVRMEEKIPGRMGLRDIEEVISQTIEIVQVNKEGELPRLKCFHNGIILIVICFQKQI